MKTRPVLSLYVLLISIFTSATRNFKFEDAGSRKEAGVLVVKVHGSASLQYWYLNVYAGAKRQK